MTATTLYFDYLRRLVQEHCGVLLDKDKEYLIASSLEPALESWGFENLTQLMARLPQESRGPLARKVVESLTPAETYFFRDPALFELLEKKVIPDLVARREKEKRLVLWSMGCSSGQEIYSAALLIKEKFPFLLNWDLRLTGSDFSQGVLERARQGRYNPVEVRRGLSPDYLAKYFHPLDSDWQVNDEIRALVQFKESNLKNLRMEAGPVDLLLLRNVLIYFDDEMKEKVFQELRRLLKPDGYLFLGSSESTLFLNSGFQGETFGKTVTGYKLKSERG
jgi:chemotaxis protein methyltransferase CheR